jgi:prolyl 4-hydroxylase
MSTESDPAALTSAAKQRLAEPGGAIDAMRMLDAASRGGDGEAAAIVAVMLALGYRTDQSWTGALTYLQRAAAMGWAPAAEQMALLAPGGRVDLAGWLAPPPARPLASSPRVAAIDGFLDAAVCDHLIGRARPRVAPAKVYDLASGNPSHADARSNGAAAFDLLSLDVVMLLVQARIARAMAAPAVALETPSVLHYAVGQSFEPHYDFLDRATPGMAQDMDRAGQRVATFLVYLNDGFEGGETAFPAANLKYRGGIGGAVLFHNVDPGGLPDRASLHAGLPPTSGEKWILSQWIRKPPGLQAPPPRPS